MKLNEFIFMYLTEMVIILNKMLETQVEVIEKMIRVLLRVRRRKHGRVFFIGVGGAAATGSHATNDFLKIAEIPTVCLSDNVSVYTALANDEGDQNVFTRQMEMHRFSKQDCLFVFSVGGGSETTSKCISEAVMKAKGLGAIVLGVVGKDTGYTAKYADVCLVVPSVNEKYITAHSETFCLAIDHLLVNAIVEAEKDEEAKK